MSDNALSYQTGFADSLLQAEANIPKFLMPIGQTISVERFNVYRNNVFSGLIAALRDGFPVVGRLVGEDFFTALAQAYIKDKMPSSPVMMLYGESFPVFLRDFEPVRSLPYLPEVAQLEWLYTQAFHSADAQAVSMETVLEAAQPRLNEVVLEVHPAMRFLSTDYGALSLWDAHKTEIEDAEIKMPESDKAEEILITRPALEVELRWLQEGSADFIAQLHHSCTLGEIISDMTATHPEFDLQEMLTALFESGSITGFHFDAKINNKDNHKF